MHKAISCVNISIVDKNSVSAFVYSCILFIRVMESDSDSGDDWSDDEFWNECGNFDLISVTDEQTVSLSAHIGDLDSDMNDRDSSSDSESSSDQESDNMPLFYHAPKFTWSKLSHTHSILAFEKTPGPVRQFDQKMSALEYFQLFYTDKIFSDIVRFTNLNAERKRKTDPEGNKCVWSEVSCEEIKAFYGLSIMMDIIRLDRDEMYWYSGDPHYLLGTNIPSIMTKLRFMQIRRYLHFSDDSLPVHRPNDKLHKVRYMLDNIRQSFIDEYTPHCQIAVDEGMIPFKGRLSFKQYMKDKPVKFGVKMWIAADSVSAYCLNFEVYVGKYATQLQHLDRYFGLSGRVVIELTKHLQNNGHTIYTDNFYTSPALAHYLSTKGTYLCGTVRHHRKGFPKDIVKTLPEVNKLPRGYFEWRQSGCLVATAWKDNKMVYYLSSCHLPEKEDLVVSRKNKDGTTTELKCTPSGHDYAKFMGGVDRLDQMTRLNKSKKVMRWYRKVEKKLLECSVYNGYVIEGCVIDHKTPGRRKRDLLSFRLELAHQLVGEYRQDRRPVGRPRSEANQNLKRLDGANHLPVTGVGKDHVCGPCNERHIKYKDGHPECSYSDNPFKRRKTTIMCEKCQIFLCCNNKGNCFKDYHTQVNYL